MAVFANDPAGAKLGLGVLERDAAADAEFFIDLPGQVRVDVEGCLLYTSDAADDGLCV